jgi:hypothetical protein
MRVSTLRAMKGKRGCEQGRGEFWTCCTGADKSLARPGRKQATATEDFDVHISYL